MMNGNDAGLLLSDSAQGFKNTLANLGVAGTVRDNTTGFRTAVYTPYAWICQQASMAAKNFVNFTEEDVDREIAEPTLRVYVEADLPTKQSSGLGASGVERVLIQSADKEHLEFIEPFETQKSVNSTDDASSRHTACENLVAYFQMDEVVRISNKDRKGEFFIVIIGTTGEQKKFKIKTKHFAKLP